MRYRIYPQKSDVLAMFLARLEAAEQRLSASIMLGVADPGLDMALVECLREEVALIQSHAPAEIAVELED